MSDDSFDINIQAKQLPSTLSKIIYWLLLLPGSGAISGLITIIVAAINKGNVHTAFTVLIYVFPIILLLSIFGFFIFSKTNKRLIIANTIIGLLIIPLLILTHGLI